MALGAFGDLVLALSADTVKFESALAKARLDAEKFGAQVGKVMGQVAAALLAVGGATGFGALVKGQIEAADQAGKMAQKIGISTEALSSYLVAAELSDVSSQQLGTALKQLAKNAADTAMGVGQSREAFRVLGIAVTDQAGRLKSTETLWEEATVKLAKMEDGTAKTAIAIRLFGRSGADLIPLINSFESTRKEAEQLKLVIGADTAAAAERFNDNMKRLELVVKGLALAVAKELLPAMEKMSARLVEGSRSGEPWLAFLKEELRLVIQIAQYLPLISPAARAAHLALNQSGTAAKGFQAEVRAVDNALDRKPAPLLRDLAKEAKEAEDRIKAMHKAILSVGENAANSAEADQEISRRMAASMQAAADIQQRINEGFIPFEDENLSTRLEAGIDSMQKHQAVIDASFVESAQLSQEAAESMIYTWDNAGNRIEVTSEAFAELEKQQKRNVDFANSLGLTFTSAFEDAIIKGGSFRDVLHGIEQDIARIILRQGVTVPVANAIGGAISSWFPTAAAGKAVGGPVSAGMPYTVGEHGPERFVPSMSGTVVPNDALGGSVSIYQTINVDSRSDQASIALAMQRAKDAAVAEVTSRQQRRGDARIG
jgi:hypothetical protein